MGTVKTAFYWRYILIAYGLAWLCWTPAVLMGVNYQSSPALFLLMFVGVFAPGLAGILLTYQEGGRAGGRDFWQRMLDLRRIRPAWVALILLVWPAIHLLALGLNALLKGSPTASEVLRQMSAQPLSIPLIVILNFLQAALEELGWRGYLLERLLPGWGATGSALLVGGLHGLWHLPLFWVVGMNQQMMGLDADMLFFFVLVAAHSVISTWCYLANSHSTLAVSLLHAANNLCIAIFVPNPETLQYLFYVLITVIGAGILVVTWKSGRAGELARA